MMLRTASHLNFFLFVYNGLHETADIVLIIIYAHTESSSAVFGLAPLQLSHEYWCQTRLSIGSVLFCSSPANNLYSLHALALHTI